VNASWHRGHVLPRNATLEQRIAWHRAHQRACGCRPVPASLRSKMGQEPAAADAPDPKLASLVAAFAGDRDVSYGGKGFGSGALKVGGKIFAMIDSRGAFVVKLPAARVAQLIGSGKGRSFDAGKGKPMKEWLTCAGPPASWRALAREACAFVRAGRG
jgi:hypothetical protein